MALCRLLFFLSLAFIYFVTLAISTLESQYHDCYLQNRNFTTNSIYESNLKQALNSLTSDTTITYGFYNSSYGENEDKVYARAICRPDMEPESCRDCINYATQNLTILCPNNTSAIGGYDDRADINCMLRYADYDQYGVMEDKPYFFVNAPENITENVNEFNQTRQRLLEELISEAAAAQSPKKYATGAKQASSVQTIYGLVQCTPDLNETQCKNCLNSAIQHMSMCCNISQGGRVYTPSCNFRYALNSQFYKINTPTPPPPPKGKNYTVIIVATVSAFIFLILITGIGIFLARRRSDEGDENVEEIKHTESLQFRFGTIKTATDNFSDANKLGQGGFGAVYKGMLPDGQQVAIKRLAMNSKQGEVEFKNEVLFLAKLQHRNLVRLLGFCLKRKERILVYEYVPESSLDRFIFDTNNSNRRNWETRYKIIGGIARGLLYLHEDSRLRIIHRDLKPSNILLDSELNPKIADFGLAKLFEMDQTHDDISRVAGTFGYMAPEYINNKRLSVKSDVFSFGVMVLEIVTGQKRSAFGSEKEMDDLLTYAWKSWNNEGTIGNLIDPALRGGSTLATDQIMKCIHIGLLCVQENPSDRPHMASVVHMLNSDFLNFPPPLKPGFFLHTTTKSVRPETSSSSESEHRSEHIPLALQDHNSITESELLPR